MQNLTCPFLRVGIANGVSTRDDWDQRGERRVLGKQKRARTFFSPSVPTRPLLSFFIYLFFQPCDRCKATGAFHSTKYSGFNHACPKFNVVFGSEILSIFVEWKAAYVSTISQKPTFSACQLKIYFFFTCSVLYMCNEEDLHY